MITSSTTDEELAAHVREIKDRVEGGLRRRDRRLLEMDLATARCEANISLVERLRRQVAEERAKLTQEVARREVAELALEDVLQALTDASEQADEDLALEAEDLLQ